VALLVPPGHVHFFHILANLLFHNKPTIQCYITYAVDKALLYKLRNKQRPEVLMEVRIQTEVF